MKLNGWYRLWIVSSMALLILAVVIAGFLMPSLENVEHQAIFYSMLSPAAQAQLASDEQVPSWAKQVNEADIGKVRMPNGHVIRVQHGIDLGKSTKVIAEYAALLEHQLIYKRTKFILLVVVIWLAVCCL